MAAEDAQGLRDALDRARADFGDGVAAAFIGPWRAGKTVHCALLKDAASKHLMRHTNGRYVGIATDGSERINRITDALYGGRFPEKTPRGEAVPLTVEIRSRRERAGLSLIFHDMAGEEYDELLVKEMPVEERILRILNTPRMGDRPYGLMAHLIFARIYVVVIDCSAADRWGSSESYVKEAIRNIHGIKKYVNDLHRGKIPADMAVVFAKHDERPEEEDAGELSEGLPEVKSAMAAYVGGDVGWFRSRLVCAKMGREEVEKALMARHRARLADAESAVLDAQGAHDRAERLLKKAKAQLSAAASGLDEAKASGDAELAKSRQSAHGRARRSYEDAGRACSDLADRLNRALSEAEKARAADPLADGGGEGARHRPATPLSYNTGEYLDMIGWLVKMANRSMGR